MSVVLYGVLLLGVANLCLVFGVKDGLYSTEEDDVLPLNNETFQARVVSGQPDVVWVVEFYNSWCGHCIHFAPTWKQVATSYKDWQDLVVIAAVDCAQPVNLETCRKYEINMYPTLKIFPPISVNNSTAEIIHKHELEDIKKGILEFMVKNAPSSWPHLQPLAKIEDIWLDKKDTHRHVLLIFEEEDSPVGSQVIIDVRNIPSVLVRRMLKGSVVKYGISKFPSLYTVRPDSTYSMLSVGSKMLADDRAAFVRTIKNLASGPADNSQKIISQDPSVDQRFGKEQHNILVSSEKYNSSVISMQDLESALHYSLRQEIAIKKRVDGDMFLALEAFLDILVKYFPGREPILGFLMRTKDMLRSQSNKNITGEEWTSKLDSLEDRDNYLPAVVKWECCQGSSPRFRGYPCSMWVLFHTLTVSAYNQNSGIRHGNPQEVLLAIRGYMKHFFGCQECSKNFLSMAQSIEGEVHDQKDSVVWLWSAHNKANKRLHGDISEDPEHPKIEFPSDKMCPQCRVKASASADAKVSLDMEKVLEFLVSFYSENNIASKRLHGFHQASAKRGQSLGVEKREVDWWESNLQEQDLRQIRQLRENKRKKIREINQKVSERKDSYYSEMTRPEGNNVFSLWGLTQMDFSLCLIFYLLSTVIILSMYHHFIVRRRMMNCKNILS